MTISLVLISSLMLLFLLHFLNIGAVKLTEDNDLSYQKTFWVGIFSIFVYTVSVFYLGYYLAGVK